MDSDRRRAGPPGTTEPTPAVVSESRCREDTVAGGKESYRPHSQDGRRVIRGKLRYSHREWLMIVQAAAIAGQAPGAWAQERAYEAAVRVSRNEPDRRDAIVELGEEMREHRRVLTNIGGNLNDLARVANSTGEIEVAYDAHAIMQSIRDVVLGSDALVRDIRKRLLP
jgi:hypothetical protein